jgi:hypothetical protein
VSRTCGCLADPLGQLDRIHADLWRLIVGTRPVEPDEGVEMHDATALEFRNLHEGDPAALGELGRGQARCPGKGAAQGW